MIVRVYFDCDMRMGIDGFTEMLKTKRVAVTQLKETDFVLFLNRAKTHFKMLSADGYMVHFKGTKRLTVDDIERVPSLFGSNKSMLKGKNLDKVHEVVDKDMKIFEDGELRIVS